MDRVMYINAKVIPHSEQRYPTVGDYWYPSFTQMQVRVSDMMNEDYEFLVLIHELIEAHLCKRRGIEEPDIKLFDELFEAERAAGRHSVSDEPGDDPRAPYRMEHSVATAVEQMLAVEMDIDWTAYSQAVEAL